MPNFKAIVKGQDGTIYTLGDNTHVGLLPPKDADKTVWFDTFNNVIKVRSRDGWRVIGPGGCVTVSSPTKLPVGPSVIIVKGDTIQDNGSAELSFTSTPPAGSVVDIIILPASGKASWKLTVPTNNWDSYLTNSDTVVGNTMLGGLNVSTPPSNSSNARFKNGITIKGTGQTDSSPIYIRAISDGERIYYVTQTGVQ